MYYVASLAKAIQGRKLGAIGYMYLVIDYNGKGSDSGRSWIFEAMQPILMDESCQISVKLFLWHLELADGTSSRRRLCEVISAFVVVHGLDGIDYHLDGGPQDMLSFTNDHHPSASLK